MEKSQYDIPFSFVDTRKVDNETDDKTNQDKTPAIDFVAEEEPVVLPEATAQPATAKAKALPVNPEIQVDFEWVIRQLLMLFPNFLYGLYVRATIEINKCRDFFRRVQLPWGKLALVALAMFILFKRDFQFRLAFQSPLAGLFADDDEPDQRTNVQPTSYQNSLNPYAPVGATDLKNKPSYDFIKEYGPVAVAEMKEFGIPASIKMAQAMVESRSGSSKLARGNNNHFGIKCFSRRCAKGHCTNAFDDHHKDFFRKFKSPKESWRAHSKLVSGGRYAHLQKYGKDYKKWAKGLKAAGYATDKNYASKLINTIEKYQLHRLDEL